MNQPRPASYQAIHLLGYADYPLQYLAERVINDHLTCLPDLSAVHIILGDISAARTLRELLLKQAAKHGHHALLGLRIGSLRDWAMEHLPQATKVCDPQSQELILVEALNQYPSLHHSASPWVLAESLLSLFSELTLQHVDLPDSADDFLAQIQQAYGDSQQQFSAMGDEARLVHSLWHAWHTQLRAHKLSDSNDAYLSGLARSLEHIKPQQSFYLAGFHQFYPAEMNWVKQLVAQQQLTLVLQGNLQSQAKTYHPDSLVTTLLQQLSHQTGINSQDPVTRFFDSVFASQQLPLLERARQFSNEFKDSPLQGRFTVFQAMNAEQEAHAIELQVRRWLARDVNQSIAIVTENRRLARRVRALLERSKVPVQDASGWALSTTSAAATIERWLECIEEDFDYLALLDLLKSPFVFNLQQDDEIRQAVYRFEQDVIRRENINRNIEAYQQALQARRERLDHFSDKLYPQINQLLEKLQLASQQLKKLHATSQRKPASQFLECFSESLQQLGIIDAFSHDPAGQRILYALEQLGTAAANNPLEINWSEFRTWLGRHLERTYFQPVQAESPVKLLGLSQTYLQQFDGLIMAGTEQEFLPGNIASTPFFNDAVRTELNLDTSLQQLNERLYHFRRLLESSANVLITLRGEENGEPVNPSPWLEAIQSFHRQCYASPLHDQEIASLLQQDNTVIEDTDMQLPGITQQAKPVVPAELVPDNFSPSAYQKLVDCPYRFYASYILRLKAPEDVSEALARDEYGRRVHRCLQAFHSPLDDLPGPFKGQLDKPRRHEAIQLMNDIAMTVFRQDENDNFEFHAWLQQWLNIIPYYIDWEITHQASWQVNQTEQFLTHQLQNVSVNGRLDRIDKNAQDNLCVIDYKTGQIPSRVGVLNGEYVQLPVYALLDIPQNKNQVTEVAYLQLNKAEELRLKVSLADDELDALKQAVAQRLVQVVDMLKQQHPLPAWSDNKTCAYCEMDKLCRRQAWQDTL